MGAEVMGGHRRDWRWITTMGSPHVVISREDVPTWCAGSFLDEMTLGGHVELVPLGERGAMLVHAEGGGPVDWVELAEGKGCLVCLVASEEEVPSRALVEDSLVTLCAEVGEWDSLDSRLVLADRPLLMPSDVYLDEYEAESGELEIEAGSYVVRTLKDELRLGEEREHVFLVVELVRES